MNIKEILAQALAPLLEEHLSQEEILNLIEFPQHASHGDLAFPTFTLARVFRRAPQEIAQELADQLDQTAFESVEVAGPYLNVRLKRQPVATRVIDQVLDQGDHYGDQDLGHGETIVLDLSSPNIAKPMSMGHLRSTVIGNALANIAEKVNYETARINHLGDWGTQFGRLIVAYRRWGDEDKVRANPIEELVKLYVHFHEVMEEDPALEEELADAGRAAFKDLEEGDPETVALWEWFSQESLKEFNRVYEQLDIHFDAFQGEAFYNDKMDRVIDELEEADLLTVDQGATIVNLDDYDLMPALIRRSDGATLYMTRDLAAVFYRHDKYDFAKALYVVGSEQTAHFQQLQAVLKELGKDYADDVIHVPFGLITVDGKKMSTRKGKVVKLEDVLNEAVDLAYQQIAEKNPDLENKEEVAQMVGVGAVVFHDLQTERTQGFDLNLDQIVKFEGETGPYVQYTYARSKSMLRRSDYQSKADVEVNLSDDYSWSVVKLLSDYPQVIRRAMNLYEPSVIAKYIIDLAQAFNSYYGNVRILVEDDELEARLALVEAVTIVLRNGLELLGVKAPEEM